MRVRINEGATIQHGISFSGIWPECLPPADEYFHDEYQKQTKFPSATFTAKGLGDNCWECTRFGYGEQNLTNNSYGNGAIIVSGYNAVTEVISEV